MNKDYYKTLDNGHQVLDFHKIAKLGHKINVIMSERGAQGKTYNVKEYILDRWLKHKEKAVWIVNAQTQIETGKIRFLTNNLKYNKKWAPFMVDSNGVYFNRGGEKTMFKNDREYIIYFAAIINAEKQKTSRDDSVKTFVYDEFNAYINQVWDLQPVMFDSLVHSYQVPQAKNEKTKIFILGNQSTFGIPILMKLGFDKLEGEEMVKTISNDFSCWMYVPVKDEKEIKRLQKSWHYQMSDLLGTVQQSFLNEKFNENMEGIIQIPKADWDVWIKIHEWNFQQQYYIKGTFFNLYYSPIYSKYLFVMGDKELHPNLYLLDEEKEMGKMRDPFFKVKMEHLLATEIVYFDTIFTKTALRLA